MKNRNKDIPFKLCRGKTKPFTTTTEQVALFKSRGLIVSNDAKAEEKLRIINYYRLSGYSLSLRTRDVFHNGVSFEDICKLYDFDKKLRSIVLSYCANVETALRTHIAYEHAKVYGPLGYMDSNNFIDQGWHSRFIDQLTEDISRSDDVFVHHHKKNKGCVFPIWVAIECISFGELSKLYKNLKTDDRTLISKKYYGVSREYIENWMQALVMSRNIAAHGGRFYNRRLRSVPIKLPNKLDGIVSPDSVFAMVFALHKTQPSKVYSGRLRTELQRLFKSFPQAELYRLGFPEDWIEILKNY